MTERKSFAHLLTGALALLASLGCQGVLGDTGDTADSSDEGPSNGGDGDVGNVGDGDAAVPPDATCEEVGANVGANVLHRLSRLEYQLTVQDLFQLADAPALSAVPENIQQGGFTTYSAIQSVSAQHLRAYLDSAGELFDALALDTVRYASVVGCTPGAADCLQQFITRFGRLAYRRGLADAEVLALSTKATANASDAADQIRYATEALLVSPHFLFRLELGPNPEGMSLISSSELASKLSFTLWGRGPSATLLDRADAGELQSPEGLALVVDEMLADSRAQSYYQDFFRQWLGYRELRAPIEPPPDWSDALMDDMKAETDALVSEFSWGPEADLWAALTANHTTVTPELGAFYGVTPDANGGHEFVEGSPTAHAGLLGHSALLSQKTDGDKISVRGNWLRKTFLCEELHIPPGLADTLGDELVGLTSIEIIEKRNVESPCAGCHSAIDPIGVGLAQFDATGRFDSSVDISTYPVEPGFPDAADPSFTSLAELAAKVSEMPQLSACLAERTFVYAQGRAPQGEDACAFEGAASAFAADHNSFASMLRGLVLSEGFRSRRAPSTL